MKYNKEILDNIDIINQALILLERETLFFNKDFKLNKDINSKDWIKLSLHKINRVPICLEITSGEIRIDIDRAEEVICISHNFIKENKENIIKLIVMILSSFIKVKYCGKGYTKIFFLDKNNKVLDAIEHYKNILFSLKLKCKEHIYMPIYPRGIESKHRGQLPP